jgi:hypothetical protein
MSPVEAKPVETAGEQEVMFVGMRGEESMPRVLRLVALLR